MRDISIVIGQGSHPAVTIAADGKPCAFPAFSPDGTRVAFV